MGQSGSLGRGLVCVVPFVIACSSSGSGGGIATDGGIDSSTGGSSATGGSGGSVGGSGGVGAIGGSGATGGAGAVGGAAGAGGTAGTATGGNGGTAGATGGNGGTGGTAGATTGGTGGTSGCTSPTQCPGQDDECQQRTCVNGACGMSFTSGGTPVANQVPGDCKEVVCNGSGATTTQNANADVLVDFNQCTDNLCNNGTPSNPFSAPGAACSQNGGAHCDGSGSCVECTDNSHCASNSCVGNQCVVLAKMLFNELNPNITTSRDLVELLVTNGGKTGGIELRQKGSANELLATLPDITVATGDLIVVHLNAATAVGAAPGSETVTKSQYPSASFSANYDNAWDVHGGAAGLTFSNRVLELDDAVGAPIDAIPVVLTNIATPPAAFPNVLSMLQAAGLWFPTTCGGVACDYTTTPSAFDVSVDYLGCGNSATGSSIQRKLGFNTKQKSDWNTASTQSFGFPNP